MSLKIAQKMRDGLVIAQQKNWDVESRCWVNRDNWDHNILGMCPLSLAFYAKMGESIDEPKFEANDRIAAIIRAIDPDSSYSILSDLVQLWDDDKLNLFSFIERVESEA